jgi:hypothetical protein
VHVVAKRLMQPMQHKAIMILLIKAEQYIDMTKILLSRRARDMDRLTNCLGVAEK